MPWPPGGRPRGWGATARKLAAAVKGGLQCQNAHGRAPGATPRNDAIVSPADTHSPQRLRRLVVLGATGSIGANCLDVVECLPDRLQVVGLSAHANVETLLRQAERHRPRWVTVTDADAARRIDRSRLPPGCELLYG